MSETEQALTPELRAAEYVLGTLSEHERAQVEAELPNNPALAVEVAYWERRLGPLSLLQRPVEPPASVWQGIQTQTQPAAAPSQTRSSRTGLWAGFAIAASMAAFALATVLFVGVGNQAPPAPQTTAPVYASMLQDEARDMAWLVTADSAPADRLQVVALGDSYDKTWSNRSLELWLLAPDADPVSLGLLPKEGASSLAVSPQVARGLQQSGLKLAVSNEPLGGSPTGAPTGEVLYVAALNRRTTQP